MVGQNMGGVHPWPEQAMMGLAAPPFGERIWSAARPCTLVPLFLPSGLSSDPTDIDQPLPGRAHPSRFPIFRGHPVIIGTCVHPLAVLRTSRSSLVHSSTCTFTPLPSLVHFLHFVHMRSIPLAQQRPNREQERDQQFYLLPSAMPSLFPPHTAGRFLQVPSLPTRKGSSPVPNGSFDDISDDLELSFASNMSLNPTTTTTEERDNHLASPVPMDISPAPATRVAPPKFVPRPRAFTSSARLFGRDLSNDNPQPPSSIGSGTSSGTTSGKKLQRAALPFEWMAPSRQEQTLDTTQSSQMVRFSSVTSITSLIFF
jgi:hypothetical protein